MGKGEGWGGHPPSLSSPLPAWGGKGSVHWGLHPALLPVTSCGGAMTPLPALLFLCGTLNQSHSSPQDRVEEGGTYGVHLCCTPQASLGAAARAGVPALLNPGLWGPPQRSGLGSLLGTFPAPSSPSGSTCKP